MAVINNAAPAPADSGSGMGFLLGVILLIVFAFLVIYYGIPAMRGSFGGGTQLNVPDKINIDVNQKK